MIISRTNANRIYVGSHYFSILDISDPSSITKVDLDLDCRFLAVNYAEDRAYCSSGTMLYVLDISDKTAPTKLHEQAHTGLGSVIISYDDQFLYTGVGSDGIIIYSISGANKDAPASPETFATS